MDVHEMKAGDWVYTSHEGNKITGFIIGVFAEKVDVFVTIPKDYGMISVPTCGVWTYDDVVISPDDIPTLIDLSLMIKDKSWFKEWMEELGRWRPVEHFL